MAKRPVVNYLNNRDILFEIHRSKASFSTYTDIAQDRDYDVIIGQGDQPVDTEEGVRAAIAELDVAEMCALRAARLTKHAMHNLIKRVGKAEAKLQAPEVTVLAEDVDPTSIVYRVMTYAHVPAAPGRKKTVKSVADAHARCNFPPYEHYRVINGEPRLVGRSHWAGAITLDGPGEQHWSGVHISGRFAVKNGKMTEELGRMILKLCERNAMKGNWRNYTYIDEMKCQATIQLAAEGLRFDESRSLNPFSYYTTTVNNSFTKVLNAEKDQQNLRDDILEMNDLSPSYTRQSRNEAAMMSQYIDTTGGEVTDIDIDNSDY